MNMGRLGPQVPAGRGADQGRSRWGHGQVGSGSRLNEQVEGVSRLQGQIEARAG